MFDHFPTETLQPDLAALVVVAQLDVLAVDDWLLLAGLTAGARLAGRDLITDRQAAVVAGGRGGGGGE